MNRFGRSGFFSTPCNTRRKRKPQVSYFAAVALLLCLASLSACSFPAAATTQATALPTATYTPEPVITGTGTAFIYAAPCSGSLWNKNIITVIDTSIPLPPETVGGLLEDFPPVNGWIGYYTRLCTGAPYAVIQQYETAKLEAAGWAYVNPPSLCPCGGGLVWSKPSDPRLIVFDSHPAEIGADTQWGITIYKAGS